MFFEYLCILNSDLAIIPEHLRLSQAANDPNSDHMDHSALLKL